MPVLSLLKCRCSVQMNSVLGLIYWERGTAVTQTPKFGDQAPHAAIANRLPQKVTRRHLC